MMLQQHVSNQELCSIQRSWKTSNYLPLYYDGEKKKPLSVFSLTRLSYFLFQILLL